MEVEEKHFERLAELKVAGILCVSGLTEIPALSDNLPTVFLDRGCENILLIPGYIAGRHESLQEQGYTKALAENKIAVNENYILKREGKAASHIEAERIATDFLRKNLLR